MKTKFILNVLLLLFVLQGCSNDETNFQSNVESKEKIIVAKDLSEREKIEIFFNYLKEQNLIENISNVDLINSNVVVIEGFEVINILEKDTKTVNLYRGIKATENGKKRLKLNNEYAIIQENYTNFNINTQTITSKKFDLNNNKFKFQEAKLVNGKLVTDLIFNLDLGNVKITGSPLPNSCYGGSDGDMSWGECMNCVYTVCKSDPTCNSVCDTINVLAHTLQKLGGSPLSLGACDVSLGVSCIAVAILF